MKNSKQIKIYTTGNLCIQTVYSLGLINNLLYSYKNPFDYEENIGYNELPIIPFDQEIFSPITKRSSLMIFNDDNFQSLLPRDSASPTKRKSEFNIVFNFSSFLNISRNEPIDNHLLIKKKNPLEDRIFDFESSVDSFDSEDDDDDEDEDNNSMADTGKKVSSKFVK